jgi:sulfite exporter TauE/SafE
VNRADRLLNVSLFGGAVLAWLALGYVFLTQYPTQSAASLLAGALLLGAAVGLTAAPLFWIGAFVGTNRIAYRGSWWRAGRRAALCGLVAGLFVLMRGQDVFSIPLAIFIVAMAVLVELTLSLRG